MIITRTPFRVSFLGGGTDYPEYFRQEGGAVLGAAVDKSAYLQVSHFYSRLFDYCIRIAYRQVECVNSLDELRHQPFRECLRQCGILRDVEVNYTAELPSFSGLGTSSTFIVGLLNALYAFKGCAVSPMNLAYEAIRIEREVLRECVGCQDQVFAAVGGLNLIEFRAEDDIVVHRLPVAPARRRELEAHLLLVYTGIRRRAAEIAARQVVRIADNRQRLRAMRQMVDDGYRILTGNHDLCEFGELLDRSWRLKAELDDAVSSQEIHQLYRTAREAGACGGKLLGAGGGGFLLFLAPPDRREAVRSALGHLEEIPIALGAPGSHIIHA